MSDVHLEISEMDLEPAGEDILVLAGDIGVGVEGMSWADCVSRRLGVPVVVVAGNHEFYGTRKAGSSLLKLTEMLSAYSDMTDGRVTFLNRGCAVVGGVRFIGATLWTDFALDGTQERSMRACAVAMNDYYSIDYTKGVRFSPYDSLREHETSVAYLRGYIASAFDGPTVIVTHHAPSRASIVPAFHDSAVNPAYASKLDALVESLSPALWVHGHMHASLDYVIGTTRVICNPRGYVPWDPNPSFDPNLVVEV